MRHKRLIHVPHGYCPATRWSAFPGYSMRSSGKSRHTWRCRQCWIRHTCRCKPSFFSRLHCGGSPAGRQNGEVRINHNRFLGYTKDEEGNLVIEPAEAEVIKRIYREYLEGANLLQSGRGLGADGILTGEGKTKWRLEALKKILQNEKYIGGLIIQSPQALQKRTQHHLMFKG